MADSAWSLARCDLLADNCHRLAPGLVLRRRPENLRVDPYHGFLFWLERWTEPAVAGGDQHRSALYRADLGNCDGGGAGESEICKTVF